MTCASCVARVERAIAKLPDVASVSVNLATESARVVWTPSVTADHTQEHQARLRRAVRDAGYEPLAAEHLELKPAGIWTDFAPVAVGMLLSAPLVLPMVGDALRDMHAAFEVGCAPYLVKTGKGERTMDKGGLPPGTQVFDNLAAVVDRLLHLETSAQEAAEPARAAPGRKKP